MIIEPVKRFKPKRLIAKINSEDEIKELLKARHIVYKPYGDDLLVLADGKPYLLIFRFGERLLYEV